MRKPHNINKRQNALSASLIKGLAITWVASDKVDEVALSEAWHVKTGKRVKVTPTLYTALTTCRTHWQICCVVFCRDQLGQQYAQTTWIDTKEPYRHSDLADFLNDAHLELWQQANANHRMNMGWCAYPNGNAYTDDDAIGLLEKRGCWDVLAPFEQAV